MLTLTELNACLEVALLAPSDATSEQILKALKTRVGPHFGGGYFEREAVKTVRLVMRLRPTQTWRFYDGMSREKFDELQAAGELPVGIGSYDEVMARVEAAKR